MPQHSSDAIEIKVKVAPISIEDENGLKWEAFMQRFRFRYAPLSLDFHIQRRLGIREMYMGMFVPNISSGVDVTISRHQPLPPFVDDRSAALQLRAWALELMTHELDEQFELDGIRIFDPHDEEKAIR